MQSPVECEAGEHYQSLVEAQDQGAEDTDATPQPHSYTMQAPATPWVPQVSLPADYEVACGVELHPTREDVAPRGSPDLKPVVPSSPLSQPTALKHLTDYEGPMPESDLDSDGTLAELTFPTQATGVSFRVRPMHWGPSPIDKARELVESCPHSRVTHRRPGGTRQSSCHSNATVVRGRSRSRDSSPSRQQSPGYRSSRSQVDSRRNSGPHMSAHPRVTFASAPGSRRSSPNLNPSRAIVAGETYPGVLADSPLMTAHAQASGHPLVVDALSGDTAHWHVYSPTYAPSQSPVMSERPNVPHNSPELSNLVALQPQQQHAVRLPAERLPPSTAPAGGNRHGAFSSAYINANYSNPSIYPNMVSAAGLNFGTPFGSPMACAALPHMSPLASFAGQVPMPFLSRSSTGNYPFHTAFDAMQSPSLGTAPGGWGGGPADDVETFAEVQRNADAWKPSWDVFPLKVYRGCDLKVVAVQRDWDDADLLRALAAAYDTLRGRLRKYFSFMDVWYVTMVAAEKQYVFPQRVGPAKISAHRNMRMRYLLAHPAHMRGQREIMRALTARRGFGVEFVEQARLARMALFTGGLFFIALAIAVGYGACTGDWIGGFSIGSFFGQNFALPVGLLQVAATYLMREC